MKLNAKIRLHLQLNYLWAVWSELCYNFNDISKTIINFIFYFELRIFHWFKKKRKFKTVWAFATLYEKRLQGSTNQRKLKFLLLKLIILIHALSIELEQSYQYTSNILYVLIRRKMFWETLLRSEMHVLALISHS